MDRLPRLFKSSSASPRGRTESVGDGVAREAASKCIQLIPVPMCVIDRLGNISAANREFSRAIFSSREVPETSILESLVELDLDRFYACMEEVVTNADPTIINVEKCLSNSYGPSGEKTPIYFDWSLSVTGGANDFILVTGRLSTLYSMNRPFSKAALKKAVSEGSRGSSEELHSGIEGETRTHLQTQLSAALRRNQELSNTLETKRLFVRNLSHEIRTPLSVVLAGLSYYQRVNKLSVENAGYIDEIKSSCRVAIAILGDVLLYERMDDRLFVADKAACDLLRILTDVVEQFRIQARYAEVALSISGDTACSVLASADATKIAQVFRNVVSNAMKFTPAHGSVLVTVKLQPESKTVRVEVRDSGPGLSKEQQERLFKEVVQFNAKELQGGQGSGFGLFIASKVVAMHGGAMGVRSDGEGMGATFFVELPFERTSKALDAPPPRTRSWVNLERKPIKVLVADDDSICRKVHARVMRLNCDVCDEASNGQEALDKALAAAALGAPYDAILLDCFMPVVDGMTAARRLREGGFSGLIFGVTGNAYPAEMDKFLTHGANKVLCKPVTTEQFGEIVDSVMESRTQKADSGAA